MTAQYRTGYQVYRYDDLEQQEIEVGPLYLFRKQADMRAKATRKLYRTRAVAVRERTIGPLLMPVHIEQSEYETVIDDCLAV